MPLIPENVNGLTYALISNKYATLKELRDDYNIYEVLDLYEILRISLYNKYMSMEISKK